MALTVEDGTGLSTAESYLSVAEMRDRAIRLGLGYVADVGSADDADVEAALRRATTLVDAVYGERFIGARRTVDQALEWPRASAHPTGLGLGWVMPPVGALAALHGYYAVGNRLRGGPGGYVGVSPRPTASLPAEGLPRALQDAVAHAAARELASPGSMAPDEYAGVVTRESIGPISVTYEGGRGSGGGFPPIVETILRPILMNGTSVPLGRA